MYRAGVALRSSVSTSVPMPAQKEIQARLVAEVRGVV